jgi:hypothetical protein
MIGITRVLIGCFSLMTMVSCSSGGGGSTNLLVVTADPNAHSVAALAGGAADPQCSPLPGQAKPKVSSHMTFEGPCHFTEESAARCVKRPDDFYVYLSHNLPGDGRFILTLNVETYKGPGSYGLKEGNGGAEVYLEVTRNGQFYYWTVRHASVSVDETPPHVDLVAAHLPAQAGTPARGIETVAGTVACPTLTS